jgi:hypothetical protein
LEFLLRCTYGKIPDYFNNPDLELLSKVKSSIDIPNLVANNIFNNCFIKASETFGVSKDYVKELVIGSTFPSNSKEISIYNFTCQLLKNAL